MAKFDTTKIEGYENMSPEEKVAALEAFEYDDGSEEIERQKRLVSKANTDAAKYKRDLEDERKKSGKDKSETEEQLEALRGEVEALKKEKTVAAYKAKYLAAGYDEALADETAQALADGDTDKVFENQAKHIAAVEKKARSDAMTGVSKPSGGGQTTVMTKEQFRKLSPQERHDFYVEHPEEYKKFYGGNT